MKLKLCMSFDKNVDIWDKPYKPPLCVVALLGTRPDLCHTIRFFQQF